MPTHSLFNGTSHPTPVGWPENVGILAVDIYFPAQYVDQSELEVHDGVSGGKYTIGLGQTRMGFCTDREDINSLCLTVVNRLLEKTGTDPSKIGRLEVGTETIIDKSKSVKSVLMQLFSDCGNTDLEGVDSTNACYGGTAALFNSINWIESSAWDGRLALAVCGDIAVYAAGAARPSGGAGAVAMLIGPNAPLVLDRGVRSSHMEHVYDFYKPDMSSEYPQVDAPLSIRCYLSSLDACYAKYRSKAALRGAEPISLDSFQAVLFHTPYCKLVQKSLARLALNDYVNLSPEQKKSQFPQLEKFSDVSLVESYFDRDVEKAFMQESLKSFETKTKPSLLVATNVGNMYTPSLYGGLVSYLASSPADVLSGQHVALFSYGSGLASSFYSIRITSDLALLSSALTCLSDLHTRLETRQKMSPENFVSALSTREKAVHAVSYTPEGETATMFPGTWFLQSIDEKHRRQYSRHPIGQTNGVGH
ncbi:hydroxymethylglutaryl-CoA synthase 1 [Eurytemora carolleeae]|uniref:hydroxymethylglutaryl-CoA synthase 1 n=1 Tax=Eurytemora carolleeae TaxID=1294199 RepID=UPI000C76734D|nr:hydroxymethylglutaryl-CoA synthase 1 [Eurytemora carolleeae]|eukprot:XP_023343729.1 hydroxymethylglutaryl-CoA synthase 1-like [Eurytemora affinis]